MTMEPVDTTKTGKMIRASLRMSEWGVISVGLLIGIWFIAPAQLPVVLYKASLVTTFAFLGYWIDRRIAPYGRPEASNDSSEYRANSFRRALIMAAVILAGALAL